MVVFLLEDLPTSAKLVVAAATRLGCHVILAERIADIGLADDADVAVLDLQLPDSSGCDTVKTFRTRYPHMPIVVFTDNPNGQCLEEGANWYVKKGSSPTALGAAMVKAIDNIRCGTMGTKKTLLKVADQRLSSAEKRLRATLELATE